MKIVDFLLPVLLFLFIQLVNASPLDSIFIEFHNDKGRIVPYVIQPGETVYALARSFGTTSRAIEHYNPKLKRKQNHAYQRVFIPLPEQSIAYRIPLFRNKKNMVPLYYRVKPKENLFRISRVYFRIPTNLLASRNHLDGQTISVGQVLHIGWLKTKEDDLEITVGKKVEEPEALLELEFFDQGEVQEFEDKKLISINDQTNNTPGMFVMHNYAKTGSIIQVLNPMLGTVAYGTVVGKVPRNLYAEEIDMIISSEMAQTLGVMDRRVFLSTKYLK